jgi:uncharacterized membrane protein
LEPKLNKNQIKSFITEIIEKEKPENTDQLKRLMLKKHSVSVYLTTMMLIEMSNEGKIHFTDPKLPVSVALKVYVFSKKAYWYWIVIALTVASVISVFTIPDTAFPLIYLRSTLGVVLVVFFPGYTIVKALFPLELPIKIDNDNLEKIARLVLSVGASLAIVPIVGLILYYSPLGLHLITNTLSMFTLTCACATVALIREHQIKNR